MESLQGIGLPVRPVQRQHQLAPQPLPERVLGQQPLQLPDQRGMPCQRQIGLDPVLQRGQAQRLPPGALRFQGGHLTEVGQQRSPPPPKRRSQQVGCRVRVAPDQGAAALPGELVELLGI